MQNTDYQLSVEDAQELLGIQGLPYEYRYKLLILYKIKYGVSALAKLFAQFIGMANSVVANNREMVEIILLTEGNMYPSEAEKANLPTIFGALQGTIQSQKITTDKICDGCAFRLGTCANQSPVTTCDTEYSAQEDDNFWCHYDMDENGNPTKKCIGYQQYRKAKAA